MFLLPLRCAMYYVAECIVSCTIWTNISCLVLQWYAILYCTSIDSPHSVKLRLVVSELCLEKIHQVYMLSKRVHNAFFCLQMYADKTTVIRLLLVTYSQIVRLYVNGKYAQSTGCLTRVLDDFFLHGSIHPRGTVTQFIGLCVRSNCPNNFTNRSNQALLVWHAPVTFPRCIFHEMDTREFLMQTRWTIFGTH